MKRILFSEEAKADIRAIPQHIAMNILTAIHRMAESGAGRIKALKGKEGEKRLRVGTSASALRRKALILFASTPSRIARTLTAEGG